nr:YqzG/YhdC family protein [Neobacillus jeddahensis]
MTIGSISVSPLQGHHIVNAQKPIPPYAKWGTLAMKKTHERYPHADIIDYLHIGRRSGPRTSTERFKLWLKDNKKEFGVFINIEFNTQTEKVVKITFKETKK